LQIALGHARHAQRQGHIVEGGQVRTSRKSWNTTPSRRRKPGRRSRGRVITSVPNMRIIPREGRWAR
jgi:hypothetical protein